jgi:hypothetical protein
LTVLVFVLVVLAILVVVFAWFVWSQPPASIDDLEEEGDSDESKSTESLAASKPPLPRYESERDLTVDDGAQTAIPNSTPRRSTSNSIARSSSGSSSSSNNPSDERKVRAFDDDIYHPLEYSVRSDLESSAEYESKLSVFERNCLRYVWRYRQYIGNTMLLGMFFGIPALQVITQEMDMLNTGNRNLCYYNELCMRPHAFGKDDGTFQMLAFNNVYSNIGYLIVGVMMMGYLVAIQVWRSRCVGRRVRLVPRDFSFAWAMSIGIIWEGLFSAMYHLCPTPIIFQIDTVFMFTIAILCFVELFRKRFGWVWSAWRTFIALALLLFTNYLGTITDQLESRLYEYIFLGGLLTFMMVGFVSTLFYTIHRIRNHRTQSYTWFWGYGQVAVKLWRQHAWRVACVLCTVCTSVRWRGC